MKQADYKVTSVPGGGGVSPERRWGFWLAVLVVAGGLLYLLSPVLTPFLVAALLAYLSDPVVVRLQRTGLSRTLAVVVVFLVLFLALLLLVLVMVPLLQGQIQSVVSGLPAFLDRLDQQFLPWLETHFGINQDRYDLGALREALGKHLEQVGNVAAGFWSALASSTAALLGLLANLVLIPVLTFYLMRDWHALVGSLHEMLPRSLEASVGNLIREADEVLGAFLKGQLLVMLGLGAIYSLGLLLVGLEFALLIGLLAGLVSFVPYLGLILGIATAGVAALLQFQDPFMLLPVALVFGVGQVLETVALTPWFVGDRIGLHPVAVIFAVLAGGHLFGFFGVLLALPGAAVLMVLVRRAYRHYLSSSLYRDSAE